MTNPSIVYDVQPRKSYSAYVEAPFDDGKSLLEAERYDIISLPENARLRIQEGKKEFISQNGNWTKEGWIYVPGDSVVFLTRDSPIMENPVKAIQAHRNGKEFYPTREQLERALDKSVCIKVPYNQKLIPTNRFAEDGLTAFAFGDEAKAYGEFLANSDSPTISEIPVFLVGKDYVSKQSKPFVRQNWLYRLGDNIRSGLNGDRGLGYYDRVRGVLRAAEGSEAAQKIK